VLATARNVLQDHRPISYPTPDNLSRHEQIIKKSRFVGIACHVGTEAGLKQLLQETAEEFVDARHICYAAILGAPDSGKQLHNDDGEPAGTAGKPILSVLQHSGFGDVAALVVRYFGGIKLGAGGLVRAYSGTASGCVTQLDSRLVEPTVRVSLQLDFPQERNIRHLLGEFGINDLQVSYSHNLQIQCRVPIVLVDDLRNRLTDATRGKIDFAAEPA
jgi:uncharacterized YigZ family protein